MCGWHLKRWRPWIDPYYKTKKNQHWMGDRHAKRSPRCLEGCTFSTCPFQVSISEPYSAPTATQTEPLQWRMQGNFWHYALEMQTRPPTQTHTRAPDFAHKMVHTEVWLEWIALARQMLKLTHKWCFTQSKNQASFWFRLTNNMRTSTQTQASMD